MNEKREFAGAVILFATVAGLVILLVWNVGKNRENYRKFVEEQTQPAFRAEWTPERISVVRPFPEDKDIFANKWPPQPTPTPQILPVPTPTATPFAVWDVLLIIGDAVQIRDESGNHYLNEGDVYQGVKITDVDWEKKTVEVRDETGGVDKTLALSGPRGEGRRRK